MSGSNQIPPPRLSEAPEQYSRAYMSDIVRALELFISQERNPGGLRGTTITLTNLPTSATGLEAGALYNDSGTVKVVS
tara:strand:- start:392 stop:625 length:234 start_codon:yes stop_codon:yes gene_type:complete